MGLISDLLGLVLDLATDPTVEDEKTTEADGWSRYHQAREAFEREHQARLDVTRVWLREKQINAEARTTMDKINAEKEAMIKSGSDPLRLAAAVVDMDKALARTRDYDEVSKILCRRKDETLADAAKAFYEDRVRSETNNAILRNERLVLVSDLDLWKRKYDLYREETKKAATSEIATLRHSVETLTEFVHEVIDYRPEAPLQFALPPPVKPPGPSRVKRFCAHWCVACATRKYARVPCGDLAQSFCNACGFPFED